MNTLQSTTKPLHTLWDGSLKATIWKNSTEKGIFYRVQLTRIYTDEAGTIQTTDSFSGSELLRIARLANMAYDQIQTHRANDKKSQV